MDPDGSSVARVLPIDGALLGDVLLRLRRDYANSALRWTLGDRPVWTTTARLWAGTGLAVTAAIVHCVATAADEVHLTLEATLPPTAAWGKDGRELSDLARATLDELAEELLWHATRVGLTQSS